MHDIHADWQPPILKMPAFEPVKTQSIFNQHGKQHRSKPIHSKTTVNHIEFQTYHPKIKTNRGKTQAVTKKHQHQQKNQTDQKKYTLRPKNGTQNDKDWPSCLHVFTACKSS